MCIYATIYATNGESQFGWGDRYVESDVRDLDVCWASCAQLGGVRRDSRRILAKRRRSGSV